jgi:excisionase family DNA binding protein
MNLSALSIPEVCAVARASRTTVYEAIRAGELIARKRGRRTVVLSDDLRRWLENLPAITATP